MLIKFFIQAIPTYTMNCFKLPKGLVKELEVLICKFNDALLAKRVWRMINNPGSLCYHVFKA